jgi:hypothetical protein
MRGFGASSLGEAFLSVCRLASVHSVFAALCLTRKMRAFPLYN